MGNTPRSRWIRSLALIAAGGLALTACSSDGDSTTSSSSAAAAGTSAAGSEGGDAAAAASTGIVIAEGSEPENPLIPADTNEVGGGKILDLIFAGLVYYDAAGAPQLEVAESIESEDAQTYTIKLKPDWKFSNGEPVTASSFVDAWNSGALVTNANQNAYFFEVIQGYEDVQYCEEGAGPPDDTGTATCLPAPKAETMSGLKVVSDTEFTVTLVSPQSDFPLRLGYSAYLPLPKSTLDDLAAGGENAIGNGPYKIKVWEHNSKIELEPNADYAGGRPAMNGGIVFNFYDSPEASYADLLSNNLDVTDQIPDSSYGSFEADLGDRAINQPAAVFQSFTIPQNLEHFMGEEGKLRRQAMSMALNRQEITDVIFNGTRTPAKDFTSPVIDGYSETVPGSEVLNFDAAKAQELWAQADAISPWSGTFQIGYNTDGGHQGWVDAVCNSYKNVLKIECAGKPYAVFAELRTDVNARTINAGFRSGWQADYPSLYNFLGPLYATGAGSNDGDYTNPEVDTMLAEGLAAATVEEGIQKFQDVQSILFQDLPAIPLWYSNVTGGFSENVGDVVFGWNSVPLYENITKDE